MRFGWRSGRRADRKLKDGRTAIFRHPLLVRASHWVSALSVVLLLLSGLQILNAHPALYWGEASRFDAAFAAIGADEDGRGWLRVGDVKVSTTGWLGVSEDAEGAMEVRAFPRWATLPSNLDLGAGRQWHFAFAWVLSFSAGAYLLHSLLSRRLLRDLWPSRAELRGIGRSILDHVRLRFAHGEEARAYNVLQKLTYLAVMFVIIPLMLVTGLAMSPAMDARLPILTEAFGGRQTARSIHFLGAFGLCLFILVHLVMVVAAGPVNEIRSMITGWFTIGRKEKAR